MKTLLIGGSGFIGSHLVPQLLADGHEVTVLNRGNSKTNFSPGVRRIVADRNRLRDHRRELASAAFEVVIDLVLSSERQTRTLVETFAGIAGRIVALSSMDVYRAYGVLLGLDDGPPQEFPITEDSDLRTQPPYPREHLKNMQAIFSWLDEDYDKVRVEAVLNDAQNIPCTILRLPMIYGPGDPLHRLYPIVKRIDDGRNQLLLDANVANMHSPRGYVEDVAHAIFLAASVPQAAGRTYNVSEEDFFTEEEWMKLVAARLGWNGSVVISDRVPPYLKLPVNNRQDWMVSSARIRHELGYNETIPREEALDRTIAWERSHPGMARIDYAAEDAALT